MAGELTGAGAEQTAAPVVSGAQQQQTSEDKNDDDIVITGTRPIAESEAAALAIQKNSDSLITVAASDSVGRLPDQNIAQATGRLPGVAVERDQGQARYISLRGGPKNWTTLSFDGINIVSPEGRDARFDSIPSAIAKQIIVSKAVTPDMPGETIAGNVNVVTRSAFDYSGLHLAGKAGYGRGDLGNRPEYEGTLLLSNRFNTGIGEIGLLASGSFYERNMVTDNYEIDWKQVSQDQRPGFESRIWAHEAENKLYRLTRRNWSVSGRMDWRPDANNSVSLRSVYTIFTDDEARDNYRFDLDQFQSNLVASTAPCSTTVNPTPTTSGFADVCIGNTPLQGTVYGIRIRQRSTLRAFKQSIFTNSLAGEHRFGGGWSIDWVGNYTRSKDDRSVVGEAAWQSAGARTTFPTVAYDFTDPDRSVLQLFTTLQLSSPTRFQAGTRVVPVDNFAKPLNSLVVTDAVDTTDAYTGKLTLSHKGQLFGGEAVLRAGLQFDQRTKVVDEESITVNTVAGFSAINIPTDYLLFSLDKAFLGKIPMDYTFRYFDTERMRAAAREARARFAFAPNIDNIYDVRERVYAGFLMGTLRYDWGSLVGGARIEHVKNRGIALGTIGSARPELRTGSESTLVFPSAHFNYNLDDSKKLRLSFNSGAARADYDQMRPNLVVNDSNSTISGGNPSVRPERAYGVDAYFEWYVRPQGYLMLGAFYKKVEDVLYTERRTFGSDVLNIGGVDRSDYLFTRIANAGSGRIYGLEAAAQLQLDPWTRQLGLPEWMGGFGVSANATLNRSRADKPAVGAIPARNVRLPNTSDRVANIGVYYEKYSLSMRLQYQYRSKWLDFIADDLTDGGDGYWDWDDELDFSARYAVSPNLEIYFDASNLLNQPGRRFVDPSGIIRAQGFQPRPDERYVLEWERFGRRYTGGVRFNF